MSDHSAVEKKAGWKKSLSKSEESVKTKKRLTDEEKKRITKIALGAIAGAAVVGGTIYLAKTGKLNNLVQLGKRSLNLDYGGSDTINQKTGKSINDIDRKMVRRINSGNANTPGGKTNCFHCSVAYVLNSVFGKDTVALPFTGVDEFSGAITPGRHFSLFKSIFDNLDIRECSGKETMKDMFDSLKNGSTGVLHIKAGLFGHYINYEKTLDGVVTVIDSQSNIVDNISRYINSNRYSPLRVIDCTNATIKESAGDVLKYLVGGYK